MNLTPLVAIGFLCVLVMLWRLEAKVTMLDANLRVLLKRVPRHEPTEDEIAVAIRLDPDSVGPRDPVQRLVKTGRLLGGLEISTWQNPGDAVLRERAIERIKKAQCEVGPRRLDDFGPF